MVGCVRYEERRCNLQAGRKMKICYSNLYTGLISQYYHLLEVINSDKNICVLCCVETKIKDNYIPDFPGFASFTLNPLKMIIYVKRSANLEVVPILAGAPAFAVRGRQFSALFLYSEFTKKTIAGSMTLSPRQRLDYIKSTFYEYEKIQLKRSIVMADMNFCYFGTEPTDRDYKLARELNKFFEQKSFENQVKVYTRIKVRAMNDRNAALDHCWTKCMPGRLRVLPFANSDHKMLLYCLPKNEVVRRRRRLVVTYRPTELSEQFLAEEPLDGMSTYAEKKNLSLEENYKRLIDWCNKYRNLMRYESYKSQLDVPWWNATLTGLKKAMYMAKSDNDYWFYKNKYTYFFNYFHKKWVGKHYAKLKHPFFKERPQPCEKLVVEGEEVTNDVQICERMLDQYIGKIEKNKKNSNPNWAEVLVAVKDWVQTSDEHNIKLGNDGKPVTWDIKVPTKEEVRQLLREIAPKKSCGASSVSLKTLKKVEGRF